MDRGTRHAPHGATYLRPPALFTPRVVLNVRDFGARGDGTTDDSQAFMAACAVGNATVHIPAGTYLITSKIPVPSGVTLAGEGSVSVIDGSGVDDAAVFESTGTATLVGTLAADARRGDAAIAVALTLPLQFNDLFVMYDKRDGSWSGSRRYYRAGEWCVALAPRAGMLQLRAPLYGTYSDPVQIYRIDPTWVGFRDFRIEGRRSGGLIRVTYGRGCIVENVVSVHANNSCIWYDRCYECSVVQCQLLNSGDGGNDYGVVISNSQNISVATSFCFGRRHGVTITGLDAIACVPNRNVRVYDTTVTNDPTSDTFSADFHGNCEDCSYADCTIYGGASWQGRDTGYSNCHIYGDGASATAILAAEILGGTFYLDGCRVETFSDPQRRSRGIIDVGGNSASAVNLNTVADCTFRVRGCTLVNAATTGNTVFFRFVNRGSDCQMNFAITDLLLDVSELRSVLQTRLVAGTAASEFIHIDGVVSRRARPLLTEHLGGVYAPFAHTGQVGLLPRALSGAG